MIVEEARQAQDVLEKHRQALWTSLRTSIQQRFDYWCTHCRPSLVRPVAAFLDSGLLRILEAAAGSSVPRAGQLQGTGTDFVVNVPVSSIEGRTFAELGVRQPNRLHGGGVRSHEDSCFPGYVGALEQAAAYMASSPVLAESFGGEEAWGEDADPGSRWTSLLDSRARDGVELRAA